MIHAVAIDTRTHIADLPGGIKSTPARALDGKSVFDNISGRLAFLRVTSIFCLLCRCCPSAISRLVVAIVIYSFQCLSRRSRAHISIEVFEIEPAVANCYAATAITLVAVGVAIGAPIEHGSPTTVNPAVTQSVFEGSPKGGFAAARLSIPVSERGRYDDNFLSASAFAKPSSGVKGVFWNSFQRNQFTELFTRSDGYFGGAWQSSLMTPDVLHSRSRVTKSR